MAASMVRTILGGTGRMFSCLSGNAPNGSRSFVSICKPQGIQPIYGATTQQIKQEILPSPSLLQLASTVWPLTSIRTKVQCSRRSGKPKSVRAVTQRFFRLNWGIYIRTRAGRHKKIWKKPEWILERNKHHVFCNKPQTKMLDRMTTNYWKRKRFYIDDPYEPYQRRHGMNDQTAPKFLP